MRWLERGHVLYMLNLPELAVGDYYKCQLLCKEGMKTDGEPSSIALAVGSYPLEPIRDPRNPEFKYNPGSLLFLRHEAVISVIKALNDLRCFRDACLFANLSMNETNETDEREQLLFAAVESDMYLECWIKELQENDIRGTEFEVAGRVGAVSRNQFPWSTAQFLMSAKTPLLDRGC
jgi:hypothetical protein